MPKTVTTERSPDQHHGFLFLSDNTTIKGRSFGASVEAVGEVVFTTGMVGYPESLTDPSFAGQILVFTYPLIGSYGVPGSKDWESSRIWVKGVIVNKYQEFPSHDTSQKSLGKWLQEQGIPALEIPDTRELTLKLRQNGTLNGAINFSNRHPAKLTTSSHNIVAEVSTSKVTTQGSGNLHITLIDCGAKKGITEALLNRQVRVTTVPWDYDFLAKNIPTDGVVVSNGPGDPTTVQATINIVKKCLQQKIPLFGICLGNQILALASGGDTYKLKFGHRGQNQPVQKVGSQKYYLTTQNHGYAVGKIPPGFKPWFININDQTNEGIIHSRLPFRSVQFHPEANPGPTDTQYLFDEFIDLVRKYRK